MTKTDVARKTPNTPPQSDPIGDGTSTDVARRKQTELPGVERKRDKRVDAAALDYRRQHMARRRAAEAERAARDALKALMRANNITVCEFDDDNGDLIELILDQPDAQIRMRVVEEGV